MNLPDLSRFDWYQASFPENAPFGAVDVLAVHGDEAPQPCRSIHGYHRGWEIRRDGSALCRVYEGRGSLTDHVVVSGADSPEIAAAIRRHVPGHRVSRADVCLDFDQGPDFFEDLRSLMYERLQGTVTLSEWTETSPEGTSSTLYAGARTSDIRVRLYEKGKQDKAYAPETVRMELQARPKKERKSYAAGIAPDDYWGLARWSRGLCEEVTGKAAPAAPPRLERVSDLEGALNACGQQYGRRLLESLALHEGDLAAFAADLVSRIPGVSGGL